MSYFGALLFSRLQSADFYRSLHQQAVALLPNGSGQTWIDVGCGPGLVTRLASSHGYCAIGIDNDSAMVSRAKTIAHREKSLAHFEMADFAAIASGNKKARVVSAASLLAVMSDRRGTIELLLTCLEDQGSLLLVEPSERMNSKTARAIRKRKNLGRGAYFLNLWAATRDPKRAVGWECMQIDGFKTTRVELLEGLVNAWIVDRRPVADSRKTG